MSLTLPLYTIYLQLSVCVSIGLAETEWLGRTQTLMRGSVTYFLDGAHTMRSMQACVNWFSEVAAQYEKNAMYVSLMFFNFLILPLMGKQNGGGNDYNNEWKTPPILNLRV